MDFFAGPLLFCFVLLTLWFCLTPSVQVDFDEVEEPVEDEDLVEMEMDIKKVTGPEEDHYNTWPNLMNLADGIRRPFYEPGKDCTSWAHCFWHKGDDPWFQFDSDKWMYITQIKVLNGGYSPYGKCPEKTYTHYKRIKGVKVYVCDDESCRYKEWFATIGVAPNNGWITLNWYVNKPVFWFQEYKDRGILGKTVRFETDDTYLHFCEVVVKGKWIKPTTTTKTTTATTTTSTTTSPTTTTTTEPTTATHATAPSSSTATLEQLHQQPSLTTAKPVTVSTLDPPINRANNLKCLALTFLIAGIIKIIVVFIS